MRPDTFGTALVSVTPDLHNQVSDQCGMVVRALDLRLRRSWVRLPASRFQVTTLGKLFTHMRHFHQAVYFGTSQGAVMPCGWEGNRRSDVALAMSHRLQWFIHLRAYGLR